MQNSFPRSPKAINEPVLSSHPGSVEINAVQQAYKTLYHQNTEVPLTLDGKKIKTSDTAEMRPPHDHQQY